jgi:hypothetical protein
LEEALGIRARFGCGDHIPDLMSEESDDGFEVTEAEIPGDRLVDSAAFLTFGMPIAKAAERRDRMEHFKQTKVQGGGALSEDEDRLNEGRTVRLFEAGGLAIGAASSITDSRFLIGPAFRERIEDKLKKLSVGNYSGAGTVSLVVLSVGRIRNEWIFTDYILPSIRQAAAKVENPQRFARMIVLLTDCIYELDGLGNILTETDIRAHYSAIMTKAHEECQRLGCYDKKTRQGRNGRKV